MEKNDAIKILMTEARSERNTNTAAKRILKACDALGCDNYEIRSVFEWLEYCREDGTPFNQKIKRIWW